MRKYIFLILFSAVLLPFVHAQDYKVTFSYDSAGNQVQRNLVCLTCNKSSKEKIATDSTAIMAETPKDIEDNSLEEDSRLTAYPNPITDILQLEWTPTKKKVDQVILFTFDNRQLFHRQVDHKLSRLDLDFSLYPSGSYLVLVLYANNTKQSFKVIKK